MVEIPQAETTEETKASSPVIRTTELVIEKNADVSANRPYHKLTYDSLVGQKSLQWQVCCGEYPLLKHSLQTFDRCIDCRFIAESCVENMEEASPKIQEGVP